VNLQAYPKKRSRLILESLNERHESQQWEEFIVAMLTKLELPAEKRSAVERKYIELGRHVARKLGIGDSDAHVVVQGSMKTRTTIAGDGREKFDLDLVVKFCGPKFEQLHESEAFFQEFGRALDGIEGAGKPEPKRSHLANSARRAIRILRQMALRLHQRSCRRRKRRHS
jgi:hypothetical protein